MRVVKKPPRMVLVPSSEACVAALHELEPRALVVRPGELPSDVTTWLEARREAHPLIILNGPAEAFPVNADATLDVTSGIQRAARLLLCRGTGLALAGGFSRTTAYIGVARGLQEARIPVDAVAGVSGGAVIGGLIALDLDWREMRDRVRLLGRTAHHRNLRFPFLSLLSGRAFNRTLRAMFGEISVDRMPMPFLAVSLALNAQRIVTPRSGPLWRAVRASAGVPGIFPPIAYQGDLLVDGGLQNPFPADLLWRECGVSRIIGARVPMTPSPLPVNDRVDELGAFRWLFGPRAPGVIDVVSATLEAAGVDGHARGGSFSDLLIQPPMEGFGRGNLDDTQIDELIERGYRATQQALEKSPQRFAVTTT